MVLWEMSLEKIIYIIIYTMEILKSATKISLLLIISAIWVTSLAVTIWNIADPDVIKTILMVFSNAVSLILWFYFWQKSLELKK